MVAVIFIAWVLASFAGTMAAFLLREQNKFYGIIVTVTFFFIPLIVVLGAYGTIFRIAMVHARRRGVNSFKKVSFLLCFLVLFQLLFDL